MLKLIAPTGMFTHTATEPMVEAVGAEVAGAADALGAATAPMARTIAEAASARVVRVRMVNFLG